MNILLYWEAVISKNSHIDEHLADFGHGATVSLNEYQPTTQEIYYSAWDLVVSLSPKY